MDHLIVDGRTVLVLDGRTALVEARPGMFVRPVPMTEDQPMFEVSDGT